jgi:hypothetical protein
MKKIFNAEDLANNMRLVHKPSSKPNDCSGVFVAGFSSDAKI